MAIPPVRAPYFEDEECAPLRLPKSANNTPTHVSSFNATYSAQQANAAAVAAAMASGYQLSPLAKEFTPSVVQERLQHQQRFQHQHNQQAYFQYQQKPHNQHHHSHHNQQQQQHNHQQHHHQQQHHQQQHQHHQRYANGHHQQYNQHQQQQQQYAYSTQVASLTGSVQDRLNISGGGGATTSSHNNSSYGGKSNNYNYNNRQHQQRQHQQPYQQQQQQQQAAATQNSAVEVETIALDYLQSVIQCLNQNPGQFDSTATRFLTIFDGMENNEYVLSNAMEDIFQESIQNPNFRYMGAKLYNLLHMLNLKKDSLFHTLLKCKLDYHQKEVMQFMEGQQQLVRETALFLAELYMQLRGDDSRIHLIAENIVFSLKQLLHKETNDNVRCICLTLKLAGYDLTADCPQDMHLIIAQLDAINCKQPGKYPLAANVISLQKNNWGRKLSSSNSMCEEEVKMPEPLRISDEPIFYGPDGRELTAEEADFLTSNHGGGGASGSTDDDLEGDLDVDLDPEMDEETEKAYKEFCKLNPSS